MAGNTRFPNGIGDVETGTLTVQTGETVAAADADAFTANSVILPQEIEVSYTYGPTSLVADRIFFVATQAYQVTKVRCHFETAESTGDSGFLQISKCTSTTAAESGTALLTNNSNDGFDLKATPKTTQTGTLTSTTANLQLAAGDRLVCDIAGTLSDVADICVTASLKRI